MLKGGIFLDMENLNRFGGWNIRFDAVKRMVEAQGVRIVRANAYMAIDAERERRDEEYRKKKSEYRAVIRRSGFHVEVKPLTRYATNYDEDQWVIKANVDVDMILDAVSQSQNLDYILIGTGDGDVTRLVRYLQAQGKRVDLLGFGNVDRRLRQEADTFFSGYLYPDILPVFEDEEDRMRGFLHMVNEDKGFGFLTIQRSFRPDDQRTDIFVHITDFDEILDNRQFALLKTEERIIEFTLVQSEDGKCQAKDAIILD